MMPKMKYINQQGYNAPSNNIDALNIIWWLELLDNNVTIDTTDN